MPSPSADDPPLKTPTGAVLAGGASRRMGQPKCALRLPDGRLMIEVVARELAMVCGQVIVIGAAGQEIAPLNAIPSLGRIDDLRPGQGPLGGIEALLASELDDRYLVCPCDVPAITAQLLGVLAADCPTPAAVLRIDGDTRCCPLPLQISSAALGPLRELLDGGCRAVYRLLERVETTVIPVRRDWARLLRPLNTPRDYDQILNASAR